MKAFIEGGDGTDAEERRRVARELNEVLGTVGITVDHTLRRRLERFAPAVGGGSNANSSS